MTVSIRLATIEDMDSVLLLIKELAEYENAPEEVIITTEQLMKDGFGDQKVFDCLVSESSDREIIGMALYYTGYSTWKGKTLYLEDFLVKEKYRKHGVGQLLFDAVLEEAKRRGVKRMDWQVLSWNKPAINFYIKNNAILDEEWTNGRLFFNI
jgi:GNAT superfamily N-acetyltransferase